jgi:hypothetical protein
VIWGIGSESDNKLCGAGKRAITTERNESLTLQGSDSTDSIEYICKYLRHFTLLKHKISLPGSLQHVANSSPSDP